MSAPNSSGNDKASANENKSRVENELRKSLTRKSRKMSKNLKGRLSKTDPAHHLGGGGIAENGQQEVGQVVEGAHQELKLDGELDSLGEQIPAEESYTEITPSGTTLHLKRRKSSKKKSSIKKKKSKSRKPTIIIKQLKKEYVEDVGGGIPKSTLLKMSVPALRKAVKEMTRHVERIKSENFILERAANAMEKRELEIEADIPKFSYRYPWERNLDKQSMIVSEAINATCESQSSDSDEDDESNPANQIFHPATDLDMKDEVFAAMSDESKEAMQAYLLSIGEVAPTNFDIMKHKYGKLINDATADDGGPNPEFLHEHVAHRGGGGVGGGGGHHHHHHNIHQHSFARPKESKARVSRDLAKKKSKKSIEAAKKVSAAPAGPAASPSSSSSSTISDTSDIAASQTEELLEQDLDVVIEEAEPEEDDEFPDFNPMEAHVLPITEKIKFIEEEIPLMIEEYREQRLVQMYKDSSTIMVYIDTYQTSYILIKKLVTDLHKLGKKSRHPLTGRLKAETLILFLKYVKNYLLSEETKHAIEFTELRKNKHRIDTQLRQNRELGESLQLIDFEKLRIENTQLVQDIEEEHDSLQNLKLITAHCMEDLKQSRGKLYRQMAHSKQLDENVHVRSTLKSNFERQADKSEKEYTLSVARTDLFRKKLRAFRAPDTMDYIRSKAEEATLQMNMKGIGRKLNGVKKLKTDIQKGFNKFQKNFPTLQHDQRRINQKWLDEIREEVEERNLMKLLTKADSTSIDTFMHSGPPPPPPVGYTGEKRPRKKNLIGFSPSTKKVKGKSFDELDDVELIKSRLPIPLPGTLMMLAQQQREEDETNEELASEQIKRQILAEKIRKRNSQIEKELQKAVPPPRSTRRMTLPAIKSKHDFAIRNQK